MESITSQSYPELEILLLNDGSTDDTLAVCRKLAAADSRIRVVDKPNTAQQTPAAAALPLPTANTSSLRTATITCCRAAPQTGGCYAAQPCRPCAGSLPDDGAPQDGGYDTREYSLLPAGVYNKVDYLWQLTGNAAAF